MKAEISGAENVEWMTLDCDVILIGEVAYFKDINSIEQTINLKNVKTLKGDYTATNFNLKIRKIIPKFTTDTARHLTGHWMVFFLIQQEGQLVERGVYSGYFDLTEPVRKNQHTHIPFSQNMTILRNFVSITSAIKERLKTAEEFEKEHNWEKGQEFKLYQPRNRPGSIMMGATGEAYSRLYNGSGCYLIVPADPIYREIALIDCQSTNYFTRAKGARMLGYYKGDAIVELLKQLLEDDGEQKHYVNKKVIKTTYPVRSAAYHSLTRLGIEVEEPIMLIEK